jgi:endonuclease YncB( thermonuclease family)
MRAIRFAFAAFLVVATVDVSQSRGSVYTGIPKIIDGDTVQFGETRLQIEGIDAPQSDQLCSDQAGAGWKCGIAARDYLWTQAGDKPWSCEVVRKNLYGRLLARCRAAGEDIGRKLVRNGWALASTTGSSMYLSSEQEARAANVGLWAGNFVSPLDWRQHNWHAKIFGHVTIPSQSSAKLLRSAFGASPPSPHCRIKGNFNWGGHCIFHTPRGRWYKRITMEARNGDRWFCTPIEAIASGCRETRR